MPRSGKWRRGGVARTDVSDDRVAIISRAVRIRELETASAVTTWRACAVVQAVARWLPNAVSWVRGQGKSSAVYVVARAALRRVWPSTSVSLPMIHSTNCSTIITIYHPGLVQ
jgi:hypothetical protein